LNSDQQSIVAFVDGRNANKCLFTPGPASLVSQNLTGLKPCFGRGDADYDEVESAVLCHLKGLSGHEHIARLQGAASLALEIMTLNFLRGQVLVVQTGYYSERLKEMAQASARMIGAVRKVDTVGWKDLSSVSGSYDWVVACYTETSCALKLDMSQLSEMTGRLGARLMVDATASIGLEDGHEKADVIGYSSCKGLFGLTGAAFVAFHEPPKVKVESFSLSLESHLGKMMTGPYHAIYSLAEILPIHNDLRKSVFVNKRKFCQLACESLVWPENLQPQLCTYIDGIVKSTDPRAILYTPRNIKSGSVVCHLGEVHLGLNAEGHILDCIQIKKA
jgi:aspartate aminotransferase-like enzyme